MPSRVWLECLIIVLDHCFIAVANAVVILPRQRIERNRVDAVLGAVKFLSTQTCLIKRDCSLSAESTVVRECTRTGHDAITVVGTSGLEGKEVGSNHQ